MAKGNRSNHPRTYAHEDDVKEIRKQLKHFFGNDWPHLTHKVYWILGVLSVLSILVAGLLVLILDKLL